MVSVGMEGLVVVEGVVRVRAAARSTSLVAASVLLATRIARKVFLLDYL